MSEVRMGEPLACVERLGFAVEGKTILDDVSFTIGRGARLVIVGPNGAGKSVLLRLLHGLLAPSAGRIAWSGVPGRQAMVFQRPLLLRRSVLANVAYGLKLAGVGAAERAARARAALDRVGLAAIAERSARVLSGGEQQRVALARAWALEPAILFLDEPTASLDPGATAAIEAVIGEIHRAGTTLVMVTHNLGQARRLGDEVLFIDGGRLRERAPSARFFAAAAQAFLKGELPWN